MKKSIVLLFVAALLTSATAFAQGPEKEFATAYESFVRKTMEKIPDIPGIAIVVIRDDKPIFIHAYGVADKEAGTKADVNTMFYIASSTKSFTALAAALLDKEGKIRLNDPITKYAAGVRFKDPITDKVTVRDLLTHTSGLKNDPLAFRMAYSGDSSPKDMSKVFAEGTTYSDTAYGKYAYDNLGYNIYAVLLQEHMNKKWQDLLQEQIFDPLGMKNTTAYISKAGAKKWTVAAPYIFDPVAGKVDRSPLAKTDSNMQSAGGLFVSIADMGKWLSMNMNDGKLNGKQVIPADVIRAAQTGYTKTTRTQAPFTGEGEYGLGWQIGAYKNEKVIYHHGGFPGYSSHVSFMPDKKIGVVVLVNDGTAGPKASHMLAIYAYDLLLGTPDREAFYTKFLDEFEIQYKTETKGMIAAAADRAKRTWQLAKPLADYAGEYVNDLFGTIKITSSGSDLVVKMGNIKCTATPFTQKETIRVEMVPGSGEVIGFVNNADEKPGSLRYAGVIFNKVK